MKSSNSVGVIFVENLGFAENGNKVAALEDEHGIGVAGVKTH